MPKIKIAEPVGRFIADYIDSVETLDVLLFLYRGREKEWGAAAVSRELRGNPASVAKRLADLCLRGLLSLRVTTDLQYRYCPNDEAVELLVDELAQIYLKQRGSVIKLIFSKPLDKITVFADAFRLRDKENEGE